MNFADGIKVMDLKIQRLLGRPNLMTSTFKSGKAGPASGSER